MVRNRALSVNTEHVQGAQRSHPDGHRMAIHAEMALMDGQSQDEDGVAELGNS